MILFELKTDYIELYKLLKLTGLCASGAEAKHVISEGLVKVDSQKETRKGNKIRAGQAVEYQNMRIEVRGLSGETPKKIICC